MVNRGLALPLASILISSITQKNVCLAGTLLINLMVKIFNPIAIGWFNTFKTV